MSNKWEQLLKPETFRERSDIKNFDGRDPFENDYGRLISSAPIRRLQDKTQVFPLEQNDFIRTRLTHSLEVSYIGSSIGKSIEGHLFKNNLLNKDKYSGHIGSILRCAGLIHDLGNPPFGHFGETAIQNFFIDFFDNNTATTLDQNEQKDFIYFDGNVQTFRILRKLQYLVDENSYNLTFPTLATIIKYPSSADKGNKRKNAKRIAEKKFGYFNSEIKDYNKINDSLGLNNNRHPLVYLLEAADDIAYSAADFEDGAKLGIIGFNEIREVFEKNLSKNKDLLNVLDNYHAENKDKSLDRLSLTVQRFRILTQGKMIEGVINCFIENYDKIINGEFEYELLDKSSCCDIRKSYKELQHIVFDNKKIMQTELAGGEIIKGLLDIFVNASYKDTFNANGNNKETRLYKNISSSYRYFYENINDYPNEEYKKLQLIVDFISGMTDSYALNLYRKLKGIRL